MYSQESLKEGGRTIRVTRNVTTISKSDLISQYFTICFSCHKFINKINWVRYVYSFLNAFSHHEVFTCKLLSHTLYTSFSQWPKHLKDEGDLHDLIRVQLNKDSAKTLICDFYVHVTFWSCTKYHVTAPILLTTAWTLSQILYGFIRHNTDVFFFSILM